MCVVTLTDRDYGTEVTKTSTDVPVDREKYGSQLAAAQVQLNSGGYFNDQYSRTSSLVRVFCHLSMLTSMVDGKKQTPLQRL
jgi:hypothetical protein